MEELIERSKGDGGDRLTLLKFVSVQRKKRHDQPWIYVFNRCSRWVLFAIGTTIARLKLCLARHGSQLSGSERSSSRKKEKWFNVPTRETGAFFKRKKFCCVVLILLSLNKHTFPNTCGWKTSPYAFCRVGVLNVFQCAPRCVRIIEIKITFTAALK